MDNLNEIELHDGNLLGIHLDQVARSLVIDIDYYPAGGTDGRARAKLKFTGVDHFNQIMDLETMQDHSGAGNLSYWVTGEQPGVTYIYLARGLISITADTVELIPDA